MSESLESQVARLADFIAAHVPGEPSQSEGAVDTALRILAKHYGPNAGPNALVFSDAPPGVAERIAEAVRKATENPGRTVNVEDQP